MSNYLNGGMAPRAEELYRGSTTFNDTSVCFLFMTRDELWDYFEKHGYLRENPLINTGGK